MKYLLITAITSLLMATTLSVTDAAPYNSRLAASNDSNSALRQGRYSQANSGNVHNAHDKTITRGQQKPASVKGKQGHSKHGSHDRFDPAREMRQALRHLWQEHRYENHRHRSRSERHHKRGQGKKRGHHQSKSYSRHHYDNPHYVRYYDNDFYVYLNDAYYRDHYRGPWWGHYHRGHYCRNKHRYLQHDDMRNLMMLGLVIDFTR